MHLYALDISSPDIANKELSSYLSDIQLECCFFSHMCREFTNVHWYFDIQTGWYISESPAAEESIHIAKAILQKQLISIWPKLRLQGSVSRLQ